MSSLISFSRQTPWMLQTSTFYYLIRHIFERASIERPARLFQKSEQSSSTCCSVQNIFHSSVYSLWQGSTCWVHSDDSMWSRFPFFHHPWFSQNPHQMRFFCVTTQRKANPLSPKCLRVFFDWFLLLRDETDKKKCTYVWSWAALQWSQSYGVANRNISSRDAEGSPGSNHWGLWSGRDPSSWLTAAELPGRAVSQVMIDSSRLTWQQMGMEDGGASSVDKDYEEFLMRWGNVNTHMHAGLVTEWCSEYIL